MSDRLECLLCRPDEAERVFNRRTVWEDDLWRLSLIVGGSPVRGFSHLEPKRHIPYLSELDGPEAETLGTTLARATSALKRATAADLVYVYVFGERVPHLHFNLAPHVDGDALVGGPGLLRPGAPDVAPEELVVLAERVRDSLS